MDNLHVIIRKKEVVLFCTLIIEAILKSFIHNLTLDLEVIEFPLQLYQSRALQNRGIQVVNQNVLDEH